METTKNKMPNNASIFFNKLGNYLDTKIYYYGSIQRLDYFPKSSDIDVDIFTDNEKSTLLKIKNFLNDSNYKINKFVYKLHKSGILVHGYKIKYNDDFSTEISIYNEKYKDAVLLEHNSKIHVPFYISIMLIIIKVFYYNLSLLPKSYYFYLKKIIMDYLIEGQAAEFVTLEM